MNAVVLNGIFVGLIYGLLALGLVVAYRGSRVVNFAHGEAGMLGAFLFTDLRLGTGQLIIPEDRGLWLALPVGIAVGAVLGALTEVLVVRPLRNAPRIKPLVGTFAVATLFFTYASRRWGLNPHATLPLIEGDGIQLLGLNISPQQLLILVVALAVLVALGVLYRYTSFGLRLRSVALDPYAAGLVGVNVDLTSIATWALAGAIAGASAILIAPLVAFNVMFMTTLSIRGLAAALIGGLSNLGGAFTAGVLIGVAEAVIAFKSPISGISDVIIAGLVLGLLILRPTGVLRSAY